jgi:biotin synthase
MSLQKSLDSDSTERHDWDSVEILRLYELPLNDLLFQAQTIHRQYFDPNSIQVSTLLSVKTGACPEDCKYCAQSGHYQTELEKEKLLAIEQVLEAAKKAKENGASRFCMGAAWRCPLEKDMSAILQMVSQVKEMGMETCMTLGMLTAAQAKELAEAGLDYYNHNLDTSPEYYEEVVTTRGYQDRLDTLAHVRNAELKICSGGILGMGESREDRAGFPSYVSALSGAN